MPADAYIGQLHVREPPVFRVGLSFIDRRRRQICSLIKQCEEARALQEM